MTKTRLLALVLCVALIGSIFAACGGIAGSGAKESTAVPTTTSAAASEAKVDIWAKYDPGITVTTVKGLYDNFTANPDKPKDWSTENNPYAWAYQEDLGIKVKCLWEVPKTQYTEKLNVAIASNQLPDIFEVNAIQLNKLVKMGVTQDVTKVYNDYLSPWARDYLNDGGMGLKQATFGKKLMAIPAVSSVIDSASVLYIRKDWLDKLGLVPPKTMDELEKVAEAFSKKDPDGNLKNDTYGLGIQKEILGGGGNAMALMGYFDGYGTSVFSNLAWVKDASGNGLASGVIQPSVKAGLERLARMFKGGYIDPEFAVKDFSKLIQEVVNGRIGMFYGIHGISIAVFPSAQVVNKDVNWQAIPIPTEDGTPAKVNVGLSSSVFYVVNKSFKHPEAAVKMLNLAMKYQPQLSPDFKAIFHFGTEDPQNPKKPLAGVTSMQLFQLAVVFSSTPTQNYDIFCSYKEVANGVEPSDTKWLKDNNQAQVDIIRERWNTILNLGKVPAEGRQLDYVDYYGIRHNGPNDKLFDPKTLYAGCVWLYPNGALWTVDGYVRNKQLQTPLFYGAPTDSITSKQSTLDQMTLETFTKIIMGEAPVSDFDKFVENWRKLGGDAITQEVNEWYNENK